MVIDPQLAMVNNPMAWTNGGLTKPIEDWMLASGMRNSQ